MRIRLKVKDYPRERRCNGQTKTKLDAQKVREIRKVAADPGTTQAEVAQRFGVSQPTISAILTGRRWGYVD